MRRHDNPALQALWERWNVALLDQAEHRIGCEEGCSIVRGDVCAFGQGYGAVEQARWREYNAARDAEVAV